jgi:pyrroline-5-carboxylate reductase
MAGTEKTAEGTKEETKEETKAAGQAVPEPVLGIVGVGGLAGFVVAGLRRAGDDRRILLSPRGAARAAELAERFGCQVAASNQAVLDGAGIVVLATPPAALLDCLRGLAWRPGQVLLSVAIDVNRPALQAAARGATVLRAMPSAAAALGLSATPLHPPHPAAKALLARLGPVFELTEEHAFDAATALAGYHLWCHGLMDAVARAAMDEGLPRAAAIGMVAGLTRAAGAAALLAPAEQSARKPLDEHGTPGTMTAEGLAELERLDAFGAWRRAYGKAIARLRRGGPLGGAG